MGELFECVLFTASLAKVPDGGLRERTGDGAPVAPQGTQRPIRAKASFPLPVCRPCDRPPGPLWGVPGPAVPGVLCVPPGLLRQGPEPPGQGPEENPHPGQLARILYLPPGECSEWVQIGPGPRAGTRASPQCTGRERKSQANVASPLSQVPVQSWFDDMADTELLNLIPIFEELSGADDVYTSLGQLRAP